MRGRPRKDFRVPDLRLRFNSKAGEDIVDDELEILMACEEYKKEKHIAFCDITHVVSIMKALGWSKK